MTWYKKALKCPLYLYVCLHRDSECLDDVLEKQADMIRYLQHHNANLGRRLMRLMAQGNHSQ